MKVKGISLVFVVGFFCAVLLPAQAVKGKSMSIQVKISDMRSGPSYTSKVIAKLNYGDRLDILEVRGDWVRAKLQGGNAEGWVGQSALTPKKVVLSSGGTTNTSVDTSEVALAGKGFNKEVEAQYRADGKVDYTWVDKMEGFYVSIEKRETFLSSGGLAQGGE